MQKKKIFITGGTSGIGLELAKQYSLNNYQVAICGRNLSKLPDKLKLIFKCYKVDVNIREDLNKALKDFTQNTPLDILIINAGISVGEKSPIPNLEIDLRVTQTNVIGFLNSIYSALDHMLPFQNGQIVAISSVAGFVGLPGAAAYSASKSFIIKYCESLSLDLRKDNIHITTICPGFIDTPLTRKNQHPMPFIMNVHKGAAKIKSAIDKKENLYIFPWQMKWIIIFLNKIPRKFYRKIIKALPHNK